MTRSNQTILGLDEAGRGPVIGPLVLCGVWVSPAQQRKLVELGIKDSKAFGSTVRAQQRRRQLAQQIRQRATCVTTLTVDAAEVDRRVRLGELNLLEQELARAIIESGPATGRIVADGARLFGPLQERYPQLRAENRADSLCPAVAAASIVAKVERDARFAQIVEQLERVMGPVAGGGYANRATARFIQSYFERYGELPPEVRKSWSWSVLRDINRKLAGVPPVRRGRQLTLLNS